MSLASDTTWLRGVLTPGMRDVIYPNGMVATPFLVNAAEYARLGHDVVALRQLLEDRLVAETGGCFETLAASLGCPPRAARLLAGFRETAAGLPASPARADIFLTVAGPRLLEVNITSALGGLEIGAWNEAWMRDHGLSTGGQAVAYDEPFAYVVAALRTWMGTLSSRAAGGVVALVVGRTAGPRERAILQCMSDQFGRHGLETIVCQLSDVRATDTGVTVAGQPVSGLYRMWLLETILDSPASLDLLGDLLRLQRAGLTFVYASPDVDIAASKGALALLWDLHDAGRLDEPAARILTGLVPHTFAVPGRDSGRTLPRSLPAEWILKPSFGYGSRGVHGNWGATSGLVLSDVVASLTAPYVAQERVVPAMYGPVPLLRGDEAVDFRWGVCNAGLFLNATAPLGLMMRFGGTPDQVSINTSHGSALGCVFGGSARTSANTMTWVRLAKGEAC
ncbi:hypothetical protein GCM10010399_08640 [Dactylosporangium fulvum]|uniref:Uncharacterized protein n=1 Tax=Dactylosporangium fulvum TaxID=53359 RepID=A0ABY5WDP7_9ACTN|nr:hypothetical protein [Dactylosporangium fulvum]UWP86501.1 hypothetical protein Dfulv_20565 [Dactylosporangium fulvum]